VGGRGGGEKAEGKHSFSEKEGQETKNLDAIDEGEKGVFLRKGEKPFLLCVKEKTFLGTTG